MSRLQFGQFIETLHAQADFRRDTDSYDSELQKVSISLLIFYQLANSANNILGLRQNHVFELRLISAKSVGGRYATDRRIQLVEQLVGNARRDFGAVTPRARVFV